MIDVLGAATDRLNESFEQLEGALTRLNFGVSASVELAPDNSGRAQRLVFKRANSGWRLMIERDDPHELTDLIMVSRGTRILAAERIEELLLGLESERDRQLKQVLGCIERVDALTNRIIQETSR